MQVERNLLAHDKLAFFHDGTMDVGIFVELLLHLLTIDMAGTCVRSLFITPTYSPSTAAWPDFEPDNLHNGGEACGEPR